MKNKKSYIVVIVALLMLSGCQDKRLESILLMSGNNRLELEKVLEHYEEDELKYKAAYFLIVNMLDHSRYDSLTVAPLQPYYNKIREISIKHDWERTSEWYEEVDAYWIDMKPMALSSLKEMKMDIRSLKADWLIREIDLAFKSWQENAYSRLISFEEFCQYVLPYRVHNGICADDSRSLFYSRHAGWFSDNKLNFQIKVDSLLYQYKHLTHNDFSATSLPLLSFGTFEWLRRGLCDDRCWFNIGLLSALGMPVAQDFVPYWGNRYGGHSWNVIIINEKSYPFEAFWDEDRWKYKRIYNNECSDLIWGKFRLPKVYRYTYEAYYSELLKDESIVSADIPPLFRNPLMKDVSSQYFETVDVEITLSDDNRDYAKYCYLCVFGTEQWLPVQWGKIKKWNSNLQGYGKRYCLFTNVL